MTDGWQPLSARESGKPSAMRDGVPEGLARPLRLWIKRVAMRFSSPVVERLAIHLNLDLDDFWDSGSMYERLANVPQNDKLLDVADGVLYRLSNLRRGSGVPDEEKRKARRDLQQLLDAARSVYEVKADGSGLERHVDPIASQMHDSAVKAAETKADVGSAASQLREASDAVRAMHPDTKKAYRMAVTAVESAAHAIIEPNNKMATLGTMLRILEPTLRPSRLRSRGRISARGPSRP